MKRPQAVKNILTGRIARQLVVSIVLFSSLITILTTAVQLFVDYRRDISQIHNYLKMIEHSYLSNITNSVWLYDEAQIKIQLQGLLRLRDIEYLEVRAGDEYHWMAGERKSRYTINGQLPLIQQYKDEKINIGQLNIVASVDSVLQRLLDKVLVILVTNAFKTFLVAGFILMLFQLKVTRHLKKMSDHFERIDLSRPNTPLALDREAPDAQDDELEHLVEAINTMQAGLSQYVRERDQAENALKKSQEKYRILVDNAEEGIFVAQAPNLRFVNPKLHRIMGYTKDELTSTPFSDFIHPDNRELVMTRYREMIEGHNPPSTYEFRVVRKDGETRTVEIKVVAIEWEGSPATLNFLSDITERRQAEEEKEHLEAQLRQSQKMEAIGTLAGGIAHDFNNLLQAISGYNQILIMDKTEDDPDYYSLQAIQGASNRAADLVRQLLLFSRKAETERKILDPNQEVEQAARILERTIPKMVNINIHLGSRLWPIEADPVQLEQILLNLGKNAADAMPDGGELIIKTEKVTLTEESLKNRFDLAAGDYVILTVSDTGHGMDVETLEHAFDPFFTTKEVGKGTGLGLSSIYGIVKSHGGHITCQSKIGKGTTFEIFLPAARQTVSDGVEKKETRSPLKGSERVLLVDDEEMVRDFAAQALHRFGYTVQTAVSGEEALQKYSEDPDEIDLFILDIGMPGMGGHRCFQEIKRLDPSARIIIASGYSKDSRMKETLKNGAAGYIEKPYQVTDLLEKVRSALDRKG